jgi:hypothetical protein
MHIVDELKKIDYPTAKDLYREITGKELTAATAPPPGDKPRDEQFGPSHRDH